MTSDLYREKVRMLAAISRLSRDYVRGLQSAEEITRFMRFAGALLSACELDGPAIERPAGVLPTTRLPDAVFAGRASEAQRLK